MNKIETAMSFYNTKEVFPSKIYQNKPINQEFKNIILANFQENYQIYLDKNNQKTIFEEVDRLTSLIEKKRPELSDLEKLTLLDEMFHIKFDINSFRNDKDIKDALKNEVFQLGVQIEGSNHAQHELPSY